MSFIISTLYKDAPVCKGRSLDDGKLSKNFWPKILYSSDPYKCWVWIGGKDHYGYGRVCVRGNKTPILAHRVMWMLVNGVIDSKVIIRHKCDNPPCVNPSHLEIGDRADNRRDTVLRNRQAKGGMVGSSRLLEAEVLKIRELYETGLYSFRSLARMFKVRHLSITKVVRKQTWRHV